MKKKKRCIKAIQYFQQHGPVQVVAFFNGEIPSKF